MVIYRAAFLGTRITLRQVSPESEPIYDLILSLYRACNGEWNALARETGVSAEDMRFFLEYAAQFLGNCGNYKGFGDSKFIPRISPSALAALASISLETKAALDKANNSGGGIYETDDPALMHLGYPEAGHMTTYYPDSPTITKEEITLIGDFLEKKQLLLENTRLKKGSTGDFELLIASAMRSPAGSDRDVGDVDGWELDGKLQGHKLTLAYGDYSEEMGKIAANVNEAGLNADNDIQRRMHEEYAKSFTTGSLEAFKQSQRYWIQDTGPMVESDLGFVETYRDPHGVRGEWEGFVAMVRYNQLRSKVTILIGSVSRSTRNVPRRLANLWRTQRA